MKKLFVVLVVVMASPCLGQEPGLGDCCPKGKAPVVTCTGDRATVRAGESVLLTAQVAAKSGTTVSYMWHAPKGRIFGKGAAVRFDTTGLAAGQYQVVVAARGRTCTVNKSTFTITVTP